MSLALVRPMSAQVFDLDKDRMRIVELDGLWRFHTGDDPRWADPNFDDSSWPLLHSNQGWTSQEYKGYSGLGWYRFKVLITDNHKQLSLFVPHMTTSYEVFTNGRRIAAVGGMPPNQKVLEPIRRVHPIPADVTGTGKSILFAIRVWHWPLWANYYGGGPGLAPFVGETDRVEDEKEAWQFEDVWRGISGNILLLINLLAGTASMILFWSRRTDREYLWFGASELFQAAELIRIDYSRFNDTGFLTTHLMGNFFQLAGLLCLLLFLVALLRARRDAIYWAAIAVIMISFLLTFPMVTGRISAPGIWVVWALTYLPTYSCILVVLIRLVRRGILDSRLMLAPVTLCLIAYSLSASISAVASLGIAGLTFADFNRFRELANWPFPFSVVDVTNMFMQLSILAILLRRFVRIRRDEQRMTTELESARAWPQYQLPPRIVRLAQIGSLRRGMMRMILPTCVGGRISTEQVGAYPLP
jgi:sigma-B regulation protein RsbU (phosphoserine phosphatase)